MTLALLALALAVFALLTLALRLVQFSFRGANTCHGWNNQSQSKRTYNNLYLFV